MSFVTYREDPDTGQGQLVGLSASGAVLWRLNSPSIWRFSDDPLGFLLSYNSGAVQAFSSDGSPRWTWADELGEDALVVMPDGEGGAVVVVDDDLASTQYRITSDGVGVPLTLSAPPLFDLSLADPLAACLSDDGSVLMILCSVSISPIPGLFGFDVLTGEALWTYQVATAPSGFDSQAGLSLRNVPGSSDIVMGCSEATSGGQAPSISRLYFPNGVRQAPLEMWRVLAQSADDSSDIYAMTVNEDFVVVGIDSDVDDFKPIVQALHIDTGLAAWTWPAIPNGADYVEEQGLAIYGNTLLVARYLETGDEYGLSLLDVSDGSLIADLPSFGDFVTGAVALASSDVVVVCPPAPPAVAQWCCMPVFPQNGRILYPWPMAEEDDGGDIGIS